MNTYTYFQGTDSRAESVYEQFQGTDSSYEGNYIFRDQTVDSTPIGGLQGRYLYLPIGSSLLRSAWELTYKLTNEVLCHEVRTLLSAIEDSVWLIQQTHVNLSEFPQLYGTILDDGSVLFEWIFPDCRLGFNVESDPSESGWFFVTSRKLGEISASGFTAGVDLKTLLNALLNLLFTLQS